MEKINSCCAVIVTYNRKNLLEQCLRALLAQTLTLAEIIIIDNAGTDGSYEHLDKCGLIRAPVRYLRQSINSGGAGGFHLGVKAALEGGCDYFWLMDDDGLPADDCLETLYQNRHKADYIGPVVTDPVQPSQLSFSLRRPGSTVIMSTAAELHQYAEDGVVYDVLAPFNGVFIPRRIVNQVGLPDKKYFIWGDEIDYTHRIIQQGFRQATIVSARFLHPRVKTVGKKMFFNLMQFNVTDSEIKLFCVCRSNSYIKKNYLGVHYSLLFSLKVIWFYLFTCPSMKKLKIAIPALRAGWNGYFNNNFRL